MDGLKPKKSENSEKIIIRLSVKSIWINQTTSNQVNIVRKIMDNNGSRKYRTKCEEEMNRKKQRKTQLNNQQNLQTFCKYFHSFSLNISILFINVFIIFLKLYLYIYIFCKFLLIYIYIIMLRFYFFKFHCWSF